mmetsp:Transcript_44404/g.103761  ORF Transcript_44404/g.103761 Transcript_44404/m.103761 type:complete len:140 (+) Transcript_44404:72-491(+)
MSDYGADSVSLTMTRTSTRSSSEISESSEELRGPPGLEDSTGDTIRELLDRAVHSLRVATNQAARRRVRQRLQRRLSDFLTRDQYEKAMQQFKFLCETRLGYVWRVAQHSEKPDPAQPGPGVCYLNFNELSGEWEHSFV